MDEDHARYAKLLASSTNEGTSFGLSSQRHVCAVCRKPRSSWYQNCHPIAPGQEAEPGICSRPKCAKLKEQLAYFHGHQTIIVEVHNHYHPSHGSETASVEGSRAEMAGESSVKGRAELPNDFRRIPYMRRYWTSQLPTIWEGAPPANFSRKPILHD